MKTCSTCHKSKDESEYYDAYKYVRGWPQVVGKKRQCKRCCLDAKNRKPLNMYVDDKPITDPVVNQGMKAWGRGLDPDTDDR